MSTAAVAENYAGALLELAERKGDPDEYGRHLADVAALYRQERMFRLFLHTPRVELDEKKRVLREALGGRVPELLLRFLLVLLGKGRQRSIPEVEEAYRSLLDAKHGRVRADVTLTVEPDEEMRREIADRLSEVVGREVVARFRHEEDIVGGLVVKFEDKVLDASVRRRLQNLRRHLVGAEDGLPGTTDG